MIQIRKNCFETNSSSTHSMVIAMADEFDKWKAGETVYCKYSSSDRRFERGKFYTIEEVNNYIKTHDPEYADEPEALYGDYDLCTFDLFTDYLESDENEFTTPNGEKIKMICRYGYDG